MLPGLVEIFLALLIGVACGSTPPPPVSRIAFTSDRDLRHYLNLYAMNADGSDIQRLI